MNLKGIQDLYDADSEDLSIKELEYDKLLNNSKPTAQAAVPPAAAVVSTTKEIEVTKEGDIMNLKFKDLESYDDIMRDYENTKLPAALKTAADDVINKKDVDGLFSKLTSWF